MKQTIRLNEADLHRIIKESVKKVLNEHTEAHMAIDDICNLLGGGEKGYNTLNMILWSLQACLQVFSALKYIIIAKRLSNCVKSIFICVFYRFYLLVISLKLRYKKTSKTGIK